jgi:hypothetical protein
MIRSASHRAMSPPMRARWSAPIAIAAITSQTAAKLAPSAKRASALASRVLQVSVIHPAVLSPYEHRCFSMRRLTPFTITLTGA